MAAGPLPVAGGTMDQTTWVLDAFRLLDGIHAETTSPQPRTDD